jgi:hypothetical protein
MNVRVVLQGVCHQVRGTELNCSSCSMSWRWHVMALVTMSFYADCPTAAMKGTAAVEFPSAKAAAETEVTKTPRQPRPCRTSRLTLPQEHRRPRTRSRLPWNQAYNGEARGGAICPAGQFGHERPLGTGERVAHQEIIVKGLLVLLGKAGR